MRWESLVHGLLHRYLKANHVRKGKKKAQQKLHLSNQEKKKIKTACNYAYKLAN